MGHLPWNRAPGHTRGYDEGGVEHLETDVMRFMAILAFCLVAIFALVQSMPLERPTPPEPTIADEPVPEPPRDVPEPDPPAPLPPEPVVVQAPQPAPPVSEPEPPPATEPAPADATVVFAPPAARPRPPEPEPVVLVMPKPKPRPKPVSRTPRATAATPAPPPPAAAAATPPPAPVAATPPPAPTPAPASSPRGFSLRFDSDEALRQLVARDQVALYALARTKAWRVMLVQDRLSFRPAQKPARFHEMTPDTVPGEVVKTLRRLVTVSPEYLTWGVTLPAATSQQLSEILAAYDSGDLIIEADGRLRLERG